MEDWAKTISDLRKEKGWTQAELARKMRVSTNSIRKWEKGYGEPSMNSRSKLKEVLNEDEGRDIEIIIFIYVLIDNISDKKLNDERMHVWDMKINKNCGTLKEYIVERMKTLLGASVVFGDDTNK